MIYMAEKKSDNMTPKTVPGNVPDDVRNAFYKDLVQKYGNQKTMSLLLSTGIVLMLREDPAVVEKWFGDIVAAHNTNRMAEVVERAKQEGLTRSSLRGEDGAADLPDPGSLVRKHQEKQSRQQDHESKKRENGKRRKRGA